MAKISRLPNAERAIVDLAKLQEYCLNPKHPRGRHKARVFAATLGWSVADASELRVSLLDAAKERPAKPMSSDEHGQRYVVDFAAHGPRGQATVRSTWIVRVGEDFPRLTSCYVL